MGWDAFGLPAENAAIEHRVHPARWTADNIDHMRRQLRRLGFSYDWERELATCDPRYYRWEQLFFLRMLERGLAYKRRSLVNWCAHCETVLANEQVVDGRCWRCDGPVADRELEQWFFRITAYAEELLRDLDRLTGWPERVLTMQRNWIGRSPGAEIRFPLEGRAGAVAVFTTRADTLFGVTFMSLAVEHPLVAELVAGTPAAAEVAAFVARVRATTRAERALGKEGVATGAFCRHPITGARLPIWVANFVLMEYGTGAVMAVPAHDQRDFEFARAYGLPVRVVVQPEGERLDPATMTAAWEGPGRLVDSGEFTGLESEVAKDRIAAALAARGQGGPTVSYRLRDWGISRQRYWGAPIPIIYCARCGTVPVPERDLPVVLPEDVALTGTGGSPLAAHAAFVRATCPRCGGEARRETDTMDTFVESSWYFARYCSPRSDAAPFDPAELDYWLGAEGVERYIGGIEHAVLHLLYARFFTKVLRDLGFLRLDEPFGDLLTQGMVIKDGAKMSKSKGNVVDPDYLVERYGADTARLFCLFASPPERDLDWSDQGVEGMSRFLHRLWRLVHGLVPRLAPPGTPLVDELEHVQAVTQETLERIRTQSQWLHPGVLDDFGLEKALRRALEQFERQTGIKTNFDAKGAIDDVRPEFAIHVYRIVQEALSNIGRHSGSASALVRVTCDGAALDVDIEDHGHGMRGGRAPGVESGLGLVSMRERAELIGGQLRLRRPAEGGLVVEVRVPDAVGSTAAPPEGVLT
jgi:leucyl-tRNA synthetase